MTRRRLLIIFFLISLLAFVVRGYKLGEIPNGVNGDEAAFGYNAYSILKTGKDEHGVWFPIVRMQSFGDYKATLYSYAAIPGIAIWGLNPFTTRLPAALFGALTAGVVFLLARRMFTSTAGGIVAGLLVAFSPWHIYIARTAHESVLALFFLVLGMWLLLEKWKSRRVFLFAFLAIIASSFSYNGTRLFPYVLFGTVIFLARRSFHLSSRRLVLTYIGMAVMLFAIFGGSVRFAQTTSGFYEGSASHVEDERKNCERILPKSACPLIFNKATIAPWIYFRELVAHYDLTTLFVKGVGEGGSYSLFHFGLFYIAELPLFVFGLTQLHRLPYISRWLIILWLLLSPLSSAITTFGNSGRMLVMLPGIIFVSSWGWIRIYTYISRLKFRQLFSRSFILLSLTLLLWGAVRFAGNYADKVHKFAGRDFKDGFQRVIPAVARYEEEFREIYISRYFDVQPYIYTAFYNALDPRLVQAAWNGPLNENGRIKNIGKYRFFLGFPPPAVAMKKENLVVVHAHEYSGDPSKIIETTYNNEGKKQFYLLAGDTWKSDE